MKHLLKKYHKMGGLAKASKSYLISYVFKMINLVFYDSCY